MKIIVALFVLMIVSFNSQVFSVEKKMQSENQPPGRIAIASIITGEEMNLTSNPVLTGDDGSASVAKTMLSLTNPTSIQPFVGDDVSMECYYAVSSSKPGWLFKNSSVEVLSVGDGLVASMWCVNNLNRAKIASFTINQTAMEVQRVKEVFCFDSALVFKKVIAA